MDQIHTSGLSSERKNVHLNFSMTKILFGSFVEKLEAGCAAKIKTRLSSRSAFVLCASVTHSTWPTGKEISTFYICTSPTFIHLLCILFAENHL